MPLVKSGKGPPAQPVAPGAGAGAGKEAKAAAVAQDDFGVASASCGFQADLVRPFSRITGDDAEGDTAGDTGESKAVVLAGSAAGADGAGAGAGSGAAAGAGESTALVAAVDPEMAEALGSEDDETDVDFVDPENLILCQYDAVSPDLSCLASGWSLSLSFCESRSSKRAANGPLTSRTASCAWRAKTMCSSALAAHCSGEGGRVVLKPVQQSI